MNAFRALRLQKRCTYYITALLQYIIAILAFPFPTGNNSRSKKLQKQITFPLKATFYADQRMPYVDQQYTPKIE
jgi:hypothetical protein